MTSTASASPSSQVPASVAYLRTLPSIRERCTKIFNAAVSAGGVEYFTYDASKESSVVDFCIDIIRRDFGSDYSRIPPHGRWRHFDVGGIPRITTLLSEWAGVKPPTSSGGSTEGLGGNEVAEKGVGPMEAARRLVDLFIVSVLLDAGAGTQWKYEEKKTGLTYARSEGLAVASLDMFLQGRFYSNNNSDPAAPRIAEEEGTKSIGGDRHLVNAAGLKNLTPDTLAMDMQVHPSHNPMTGLEGRTELLVKLGKAVSEDPNGFFVGSGSSSFSTQSADLRRPGNLVDYLANHPSTSVAQDGKTEVQVPVLWEVLIYGLAPIWPASRTTLDGVAMGDVWPNSTLAKLSGDSKLGEEATLVPFHKLTQWMCYSLLECMEKTLGWRFVNGQDQTGLPEYRNGGLFVDLGVLTPTAKLISESESSPNTDNDNVPSLKAEHPAIVEWRAMTVILLDRTAEQIRSKLGLTESQLNLKQVLEAATWKGGREIAKIKRPNTGGPPINVVSDGTVF